MITIDIQQAMSELTMIAARAVDMQPVLHTIGGMEADKIWGRIRDGKVDPWGNAWEPWVPFTRSERERKGNVQQGLLWDTGALLDSFEDQSAVNANPMEVVIGTRINYAEELQEGRPGQMVARPFLGWNAADFPIIEGMVAAYLTGIAP
jgi:phage gpG-like protein